ncbi:MAG: prolyl-tRNA synthetase associated domain-containing protein [Pseudobdellovibrionaceae bacterium]
MPPDPTPLYNATNFLSWLKKQDLEHRLYHHEAVFTVDEAHKIEMDIPGFHSKNLFLKDKKGAMALVTLGHETRVDLKKLGQMIGLGRVSFGSPELLWAKLGVRPGSVTPLAILNNHENDVALFLDHTMMTSDWINVHPLENTMTLGLPPQGLMTILEKHAKTAQIIHSKEAVPEAAAS